MANFPASVPVTPTGRRTSRGKLKDGCGTRVILLRHGGLRMANDVVVIAVVKQIIAAWEAGDQPADVTVDLIADAVEGRGGVVA